jgi:hypothetical protein
MSPKNGTLKAAVALMGLCGGCATTVPAQLQEARGTYAALSAGPVAELSPAALAEAKQVLDQANRELEEHGDTSACRDYAYIAQNKLELADAMAHTELERRTMVEALRAHAEIR